MLRTLANPIWLVGMLVGFLAAIFCLRVVQAGVARLLGDRAATRGAGRPRDVLDPIGAVVAAIAVPGWGRTAEVQSRSNSRRLVALLAGPVVVAALGFGCLAAYLGVGGPRFLLDIGVGPGDLIVDSDRLDPLVSADQAFWLAAGIEALAVAVLSLVPLPPLTGWRVAELFSSNSLGWQRARLWLAERNIGVVILLVVLILPWHNGRGLLVEILDAIVRPLSGLVG